MLQFCRECERKSNLEPRKNFADRRNMEMEGPVTFFKIVGRFVPVLKMTHEDDLRGVKAVGTQLFVLSSERLCALKRPVRTGMARSAHLSGEVQLC